MFSHKSLKLIVFLFTAGSIALSASAANVVYDNTAHKVTASIPPDGICPFSPQIDVDWYADYEPTGDEIVLAGTERQVVQFDLIVSSSHPTTVQNLTLAFYLTDGLDAGENPGAPGTQLWASQTLDSVSVNGPPRVSFTVPGIVVPDRFIWIATAYGRDSGLQCYENPTAGYSPRGNKYDYYWDNDYFDQEWRQLYFGSNGAVANFGATVYAESAAVPEPTTLACSLTLLAIGACRRRAATLTRYRGA